MNDPILAEISFSEGSDRCKLRVFGGLNYLRGNSRPHFSITGELFRNGRLESCGCLHEDIEARFPGRFTDLIRIHLSEDNGVPMHAAANGLFWLAGTVPHGYGEAFHGGNGSGKKTPEECMAIALDHFRVKAEDIAPLIHQLGLAYESLREKPKALRLDLRKLCEAFCDNRREIWEAEAKAAVASHRLVIFGDAWAEPKAA